MPFDPTQAGLRVNRAVARFRRNAGEIPPSCVGTSRRAKGRPSLPSFVRVNGMTTKTVATAKAFEADPSRRFGMTTESEATAKAEFLIDNSRD